MSRGLLTRDKASREVRALWANSVSQAADVGQETPLQIAEAEGNSDAAAFLESLEVALGTLAMPFFSLSLSLSLCVRSRLRARR